MNILFLKRNERSFFLDKKKAAIKKRMLNTAGILTPPITIKSVSPSKGEKKAMPYVIFRNVFKMNTE